MSYLYGKVRDRFAFLATDIDILREDNLAEICFRVEEAYRPYVRKFTEEVIADIMAVGYKYAFFEKRVPLPLLSAQEKRLLLTAVVSADYKEDKAYIERRLRGQKIYCLDGFFRFRLRDLQKRWESVLEYLPETINARGVEEFVGYLTEEAEGNAFVKEGKAYDGEYRVLSRSVLTGQKSVVAEILLCGAGHVCCFGKTDDETRDFLQKYYGEKARFY